jgi:hypothetical protein
LSRQYILAVNKDVELAVTVTSPVGSPEIVKAPTEETLTV